MTIADEGALIVVDETGFPRIVDSPVYRPYFEPVSIWDYYPDFSAKNFAQMDGQFQRHVYAHHTLSELADREDFMGDAIREYLRERPQGNYQKKNYEQQLDAISDDKQQTQPGESDVSDGAEPERTWREDS